MQGIYLLGTVLSKLLIRITSPLSKCCPVGGLVFSNAWTGQYEEIKEWQVSNHQFSNSQVGWPCFNRGLTFITFLLSRLSRTSCPTTSSVSEDVPPEDQTPRNGVHTSTMSWVACGTSLRSECYCDPIACLDSSRDLVADLSCSFPIMISYDHGFEQCDGTEGEWPG